MHWRILNRPHQEIKSQAALCIQVRIFGHVTGFRSVGVPAHFFFKILIHSRPTAEALSTKSGHAPSCSQREVCIRNVRCCTERIGCCIRACVVWPYIIVIVVLLLHLFPHVPAAISARRICRPQATLSLVRCVMTCPNPSPPTLLVAFSIFNQVNGCNSKR